MSLRNITLSSFQGYRTGTNNWNGIPIEFLNVFRALVTPSRYKYNFKGTDRKGRSSYLKLYAETFSVSFREAEVIKAETKREQKQALREIKQLLRKHNIGARELV